MAEADRYAYPLPAAEGGVPEYSWRLTPTWRSDDVKLVVRPCVLPVLFVPGIMGSNLRSKSTGKPVWRLDGDWVFGEPVGLLFSKASKGPGERQVLLHPSRVEVDDRGSVGAVQSIGDKAAVRRRGWGQVGETSYRKFLEWLEEHLNQVPPNPALWKDFKQAEATIGPPPKPGAAPKLSPGVKMGIDSQPFGNSKPFESLKTDDLLARARFNMPVHAFGYNWLGSCADAGKALKKAVEDLIALYDKDPFWCRQVVLVTHSMGGLVARYCANLPGMADKIAGIVHGVMPAIGAAVAYRRCKVGMRDESRMAGLVIGSNGPEVTAVFAQAPGALQLLPSAAYPKAWLRLEPKGQAVRTWPSADPYGEIYRRTDVWWGLVREAWLSPAGGMPIDESEFLANVDRAEAFHTALGTKYHPFSHVIYGASHADPKDRDKNSFETLTWAMKAGLQPAQGERPSVDQVVAMGPDGVRTDGSNQAYVGGQLEVVAGPEGMVFTYETSFWELQLRKFDSGGDGTVPIVSGKAPGAAGVVQQFALAGFDHEPAFKDKVVQRATLYALMRVAARAKKP